MSGNALSVATTGSSVLGKPWLDLVDAASVTDFGDQAVVLPLAAVAALVFALLGWRRGVLAWTGAIGSTLGLVLLLKLRFFACDHLLLEGRPGNPSGHTAAAAAVYGGLFAAAMRSVWDNARWVLPCTAAVAVVLAVIVGVSRLALDLHSIAEALTGGAIGVGGALAFAMLAGPPLRSVRPVRVLAMGLLTMIVLYGFHMPAEPAIESMAMSLWPFSQCI
jgi:membrane-associated phospholipid phosphatase